MSRLYMWGKDERHYAVVGVELKRLLYLPSITPEGEDFANLIQALRRLVPKGNFSLRYIVTEKGKVRIALLFRLEDGGKEELSHQAQSVLEQLNRCLKANLKGHEFETTSEVESFLAPFAIGEVVEIGRWTAIITIATWELQYQQPIGFTTGKTTQISNQRKPKEKSLFYVCPWLKKPDSLRRLCQILSLQPEPCLVDFRLIPFESEKAAKSSSQLEQDIVSCEQYLADKQDGPEQKVLTIRAKMMRDWLFAQCHLLKAPENAFLLHVWIAAQNKVAIDLISALGTALTLPIQASATSSPYLAGGFQVKYLMAEAMAPVLTQMEEVPLDQDPLPHLFDSHSAGNAFLLPQADGLTFPGIDVSAFQFLETPLKPSFAGSVMGQAIANDRTIDIRLKLNDHRRHVYVIGQTGVGKTTLIASMALENIRTGHGVAVLDPHGDLIEHILLRIPKSRLSEVCLFDPGDTEYPIGLNLLEWETEDQRAFLVDEMLAMLRLLYTRDEMGPMFWRNIRYGLLLLMANKNDPGTLLEFSRLFTDPGFHHRWFKYVQDPLVRQFWEEEFPKVDYRRDAYLQYVISKFDPFITHPLMRNIIGQRKSSLNFDETINNGAILLVNLAKGKLGEMNSALLGMIVIAKLYTAATRRIGISEWKRKDFFLYVDEFQNLATDTFAYILSEARKFRLNLTLCNQYITQLPNNIVNAILGNVSSLVVFRVGPHDADMLKTHFDLPKEALTTQPNYHAYTKLMVNGLLTPPFSMWTKPETLSKVKHSEDIRDQAIQQSRQRYAKTRDQVENEIEQSLKWDFLEKVEEIDD